ncbi:MAG TPA: hypothetical protein VJK05_01415 [archaeon]|nr:hypothetical protein [archaeon]
MVYEFELALMKEFLQNLSNEEFKELLRQVEKIIEEEKNKRKLK